MPIIECHAVEKHFQPVDRQHGHCRWRMDEISISPGERIIVTGPSGCGKTTLLNLLAGLLRPDAGTITVNGVRVDTLSTPQADIFRGQHLGLIFQSFQLIASLTVFENILLGARYGRKWDRHEGRDRAEQLLKKVGLNERKDHRPARLSIGEQQRVAIARALINEPPLLLADEPTASLDRANTERVLDLLFALCAEHNSTLVTVSHDQQMASRFDRIVDLSACMQRDAGEVAHV